MERTHEIEIRHLLALRAVADEGSFAYAAAALGYSQAAISQQIAGLERIVGESLFDRPGGPRPATLTPAGRLVLHHGDAILDRLDRISNELRQLQTGAGGRVVCGTFQSMTVALMPDLFAAMRQRYPDVAVQLYEHDENEELVDRLIAGDIDVTFLAGPFEDPRVEFIELGHDPFVAITPRDESARPSKTPLSVRELGMTPLIGQKESVYQSYIDDAIRASGVNPHYVFRTNDNAAVQAMVRAGLGLAIMPLLAVDSRDPDIVVRHLKPEIPPRAIYLGLRKEGSRLPAAEHFVALAKKTTKPYLPH